MGLKSVQGYTQVYLTPRSGPYVPLRGFKMGVQQRVWVLQHSSGFDSTLIGLYRDLDRAKDDARDMWPDAIKDWYQKEDTWFFDLPNDVDEDWEYLYLYELEIR